MALEDSFGAMALNMRETSSPERYLPPAAIVVTSVHSSLTSSSYPISSHSIFSFYLASYLIVSASHLLIHHSIQSSSV